MILDYKLEWNRDTRRRRWVGYLLIRTLIKEVGFSNDDNKQLTILSREGERYEICTYATDVELHDTWLDKDAFLYGKSVGLYRQGAQELFWCLCEHDIEVMPRSRDETVLGLIQANPLAFAMETTYFKYEDERDRLFPLLGIVPIQLSINI